MGYNGHVQCSTCNHPRLEEINKDLYERKMTLSEISKKYGNFVSESALSTHRSRHMGDYIPDLFTPQLHSQVQMNLGVFGTDPVKERGGSRINECVTHAPVKPQSSDIHVHVPSEITDKKSIDDLIIETKVKQIVLTTLKELGICECSRK